MVWREQSDRVTDCYFCITSIRGLSRKNMSKISYSLLKSAIKPVPHDPDLKRKTLCLLMNVRAPVLKVSRIILNQIAPFNMSLRHSSSIRNAWMIWCVICIYPKRMQKCWGPGSNSGIHWNQEQPCRRFVAAVNTLFVIKQVQKIYAIAKIQMGWWLDWGVNIILFTGGGSSTPAKQALKPCCCTMVISNHQSPWDTVSSERKPIINEDSSQSLGISQFNWKICSDLKVVSLLLGLQLGYTKHMCFLCPWNSRQDSSHYAVEAWPPRQSP